MKKSVALALLLCMLFSCMGTAWAADTQEAVFLYVATDGQDTNNGTIDAPYATLTAAIEAARGIDGTVVINLRGGVYQASETISLTSADSDLVIRAYKDEEVEFTAGNKVPYSAFSKVTDTAILNRIIEKNGKDKVMQASLKDLGITDYGQIRPQGFLSADDQGFSPTLTFNDDFLTLACYPNDKYLMINKVIDDGSKNDTVNGSLQPCSFTTADTRYKKWAEAKEIWAFGFFRHDWAEGTVPAEVDIESGTINTYCNKGYNPVTDRRVKFINLLEELDAEGEWYVDRDSGILYLIPPKDFKAGSEVVFTSYNKDFITIDGAKNLTIQGIRFANTLARGIFAKNCENFVVDACEFTGIGDKTVVIETSKDSGVQNSYIHDISSWGIDINCGDRETLTPGNCFAKNNLIETFSQHKVTYAPAIVLNGVGNIASHNEMHDAPHFAMSYGGNDQIIEYNNIYEVCKDTADSGAIYTGRDWSCWGNEIRYNYFHDLEMISTTTGMQMQAVYLDDMHSQTKVNNNVFYRVDSIALYGGGRNNTFQNNIMLECKKPFVIDSRGTGWALEQAWLNPSDSSSLYQKLKKFPYKEGIWNEKYPELANILEDEPTLPKYNIVSNNVEYKSAGYNLDENVVKYGTIENNIEITKTDSFADYKNKDFTVLEDSEIKEKLPEFEIIPFKEIGRQEYTIEDNYVDKGNTTPGTSLSADAKAVVDNAVVLAIGTPNAYVEGTRTLVDPANNEVQPIVAPGDRTLVPVRFIAESFGAEVGWDEATQTVTITLDGVTTTLVIGSKEMKVGDQTITLDVEAQTMNDRTLLPLRAIAEQSLGKVVFWDGPTELIVISDEEVITNDQTTIIKEIADSLK